MSKMSKVIAGLGVVAALGVAALPMASYAAVTTGSTGDVEITTSIAGTLSLTASDVNIPALTNNGDVQTGVSNIVVTSNNISGYTLNIKADDPTLSSDSGDTIDAGAPAQTTSAWGYKAWGTGTAEGTDYTGVTTTDAAVKKTAAPTAHDGDKWALTFGASADSSQAAGNYSGTVTLTAVTNN